MATKAPQPRARVVVADHPSEDTVQEDVGTPVAQLVTVVIPHRYTLTLDDGAAVVYEAGTREMPRDHAEHWWSRTQGVSIYTKEA